MYRYVYTHLMDRNSIEITLLYKSKQ